MATENTSFENIPEKKASECPTLPSPRDHGRATRSENVVPGIKCKTTSYMNSFYPDAVKIWNNIGTDLRQASSLSIFKSNILRLIRPPKRNIFNVHDPKGMKRLFQLRVGLSPLRRHKKNHKFKDTPTDTCRCLLSSETTEHFLLHCNLYTEARIIMFQVINPILASNGLRMPNNS